MFPGFENCTTSRFDLCVCFESVGFLVLFSAEGRSQDLRHFFPWDSVYESPGFRLIRRRRPFRGQPPSP